MDGEVFRMKHMSRLSQMCMFMLLWLVLLCSTSFSREDLSNPNTDLNPNPLHYSGAYSSTRLEQKQMKLQNLRQKNMLQRKSSTSQMGPGPREGGDWKQKTLRANQEDFKTMDKRGKQGKDLKFKTFKVPAFDSSASKLKVFRKIETSRIQFAHIPKTGGESLAIILRQSFPKGKVDHRQLCFSDLYKPKAVNIAFVRDPMSHVKSQFLFCRDTGWGKKHRSNDFPISENEYDDYLAWLQNFQSLESTEIGHLHDYNCMDPRNAMTRHLSCSGMPDVRVPKSSSGHPPQHGLDQPLNETRAMESLDKATIVGVTKYMQESVCILFEHYQKPCPIAASANHGVRSSKTRLLGNETIDSIVRQLTKKDERVYQYGLTKFKEQLFFVLGRRTTPDMSV